MFYFATAQRGVSWQDSGMFQWRVLSGDCAGKLGLALAHPLYIAGGRVLAAVSKDHLPLLLNCFSGLGMAVALANLAGAVTLLTGRRWIGCMTAGMLAVTHTAWWLATVAEVYTWTAAGLTGELWLLVCLLKKPGWQWLAGLALVSGLGLCVHNFALLPLPVYAVTAVVLVARGKLPAWSLAVAAAAWVAGAGLYLGMTAELAMRTGDLVGAVRSALVGDYAKDVLNVSGESKNFLVNAALSGMNFVNFLLPLAVVGWWRLRKQAGPDVAGCLGAITVIELAFFVRYPVPDQFTFILPSMVMICLAAGVGIGVLAERSPRWRLAVGAACLLSMAWQPVFYAAAPALAAKAGRAPKRERELPYRDEARYWLVPWKHDEHSAADFARAALEEAAPTGVIVADSTSEHPLLVERELEMRSDAITIQYDGQPLPLRSGSAEDIRRALAGRQLLAVSPAGLPKEIHLQKAPGHVLYKAMWLMPDQ